MTPSYVEEISSHIPALHLLTALGYIYLTPADALMLRGGKLNRVILEPILADWMRDHNQAQYKGQAYPFSEGNIQTAVGDYLRIKFHQI